MSRFLTKDVHFLILSALLFCGTAAADEPLLSTEYRTLSGRGNNIENPSYGAAENPLCLETQAFNLAPTGANRPSPREISNKVMIAHPRVNHGRLTDLFTYFAQFLDHDFIRIAKATNPDEFPIEVPSNDPVFFNISSLPFNRSARVPSPKGPSQQNLLSSFIDASVVYGTTPERLALLREPDQCEMRVSPANKLPREKAPPYYYIAGDDRVNENIALLAMHTLFLREHNRLCGALRVRFPTATTETLFKETRKIVGAELQAIVYKEFLPVILGNHLPLYAGYDPHERPAICRFFADAAFRIGHTLINDKLLLVKREHVRKLIPLKDAMFNPNTFDTHGIDAIMRGLVQSHAADVNVEVVDSVRNMLSLTRGGAHTDLAAMNIQRGRDSQVPSYNDARKLYGLAPVSSYQDITSDPALVEKLRSTYGENVEELDAWVGGLAEDKASGSVLGPLFQKSWQAQFASIRNGDRFYFKRKGLFRKEVVEHIPILRDALDVNKVGTMRDVMLSNLHLDPREIPENPFRTAVDHRQVHH